MNEQTEEKISMPALLSVSPSPHIKSGVTTTRLMADVLIALLPATVFGIFQFGLRALELLLVSVASAMGFEWGVEKILHRKNTILDLSAVVTGVLLWMNLPASVPLWLPAMGSFFAIVVIKQLFGGIGKNFLNPALGARVFLFLSWSDKMASFPAPKWLSADAVAGATPLAALRAAGATDVAPLDLFLGKCAGCMGEISAVCLLAGGIYLIVRKVISWRIPVCYIGTVALLTFLLPKTGAAFDVNYMLSSLFSGGLMLGAIFMATDYVTSPVTRWGRILFGVGCGLLTVLFRYFSSYPEGVSFSILVMNCLVYYIDRLTKPRVFGSVQHDRK